MRTDKKDKKTNKYICHLILLILSLILLSAFILADVDVKIQNENKVVKPGEDLLVSIKLVNLENQGRQDVYLDFEIKNSQNETIIKKKETVAVETQANFVRTFEISKDALPGKYTFHIKITYFDGKEYDANELFQITRWQIDRRIYYAAAVLIFLALLIYLIIKLKPVFIKIKLKYDVWKMIKKRKL
jgi:hypothetical protein